MHGAPDKKMPSNFSRRDFLKQAAAFSVLSASCPAMGAPGARTGLLLQDVAPGGLVAKVVKVDGVQKIRINDQLFEPLAFRSFRPEARNISEFYQAGVRLMSILSTGQNCTLDVPYSTFGEMWIGPGQYDFSKFDRQMELFLEHAPEAYFNVMLQIDTKDWYLKARPEASNTFWNLVEMAGDPQWREDTARFLRDALRTIEGKYGHKVFAYSLFCGSSTEWYTNSQGNGRPEAEIRYHPLKEQSFRRFMKNDTIRLPRAADYFRTSNGVFRDPMRDRLALDYWRFHHEIIGDVILYFAGQAQEMLEHRKLLGLYYGYLNTLNGTRLLHEGHLGYERVWRSPDIDMIFSPARYGPPRRFDGASGYLTTVDSIALSGKLNIQEIDHTTHIAPTRVENGRVIPGGGDKLADAFQTRMVLRREFALTRVKRTGMWWFDFFGGYYYAEPLMKEVANMVRVGRRLKDVSMRSVAEVAVFGDVGSMFYASSLAPLSDDLLVQPPDALARLGAPFDIYTLSDIENPALPLDQYKLVVFLNAFTVSQERRDFIEKHIKAQGRTVLWIYAPGYISGNGFSIESMRELTGIRLAEHDGVDSRIQVKNIDVFSRLSTVPPFGFSSKLFPLFRLDDPDAKVLGAYATSGAAALGYKKLPGHTAFYCAAGNIPAAIYREIARAAGVHIYYEGNDPVYVNSRLIGIHQQKETGHVLNFSGAMTARLEELFDGGFVQVRDGRAMLPAAPGEMKLYLIDDGEIHTSNIQEKSAS